MSGNPNGKFGAETENAIQKYCKENNLYLRKIINIELQKYCDKKNACQKFIYHSKRKWSN